MSNLLDRAAGIERQFNAHVEKFQAGCDTDDFYKAKKALNDMVTFHNELAKIRDRLERAAGSNDSAVRTLDEKLDTWRGILSDDRLSHYELSHREVK